MTCGLHRDTCRVAAVRGDWVNALGHQVVPTSRQHPGGAHPVPDVLGRGTRRGRLGEVECAPRPVCPHSPVKGLHWVTGYRPSFTTQFIRTVTQSRMNWVVTCRLHRDDWAFGTVA